MPIIKRCGTMCKLMHSLVVKVNGEVWTVLRRGSVEYVAQSSNSREVVEVVDGSNSHEVRRGN